MNVCRQYQRAADRLGLSRVGLRAKIERYELRREVTPDDADPHGAAGKHSASSPARVPKRR